MALLAAYVAVMVRHAQTGHRRSRSRADFYVGGRALGGWALGISFFATYSSTNSFVGFAGQGYAYGAPWLLLMPCAVLFSLLAWWVVAPRLRRFSEALGSLTVPDFIGFRFASLGARVVAAVIVVFASLLYMTAVFKGSGNLLEVFLDVPYPVAIGLVLVVVVLYTAAGGFHSVVKTDVVQGVLMSAAAVVLLVGTVRAARRLGAGASEVPPALFDWNAAMPFPVLLGIMVAGTMKLIVEPRQLSRFYALDEPRAVRRGMLVSTLLFGVVYAMLVPIGLLAHRVLGSGLADTDRVVPELLADAAVFPGPMASLLVVAMIAAAMSSLDSVLLVTASTCERDLISPFVGASVRGDDEARAVRTTRILVVVLALATAGIALRPPGQIVAMTAFSGSLYAACFFPSLILGLHWRRGSGAAALTSMLLGLAVLLVWDRLPTGLTLHPIFPALVISTLSYASLAVAREPVKEARVARLFER